MSSSFSCSPLYSLLGLVPKCQPLLGLKYQNHMGHPECTEGLVGNILLFDVLVLFLSLLSSSSSSSDQLCKGANKMGCLQ